MLQVTSWIGRSARWILIGAFVPFTSPCQGAQAAGEHLVVPMPSGFHQVTNSARGDVTVLQFVPSGERAENWSRLVTIQIDSGQGGTSIAKLVDALRRTWGSRCRADVQPVSEGQENGYSVYVGVQTCAPAVEKNQAETIFFKVIAGKESSYTAQYAYDTHPPVDIAMSAINYLAEVVACKEADSLHLC